MIQDEFLSIRERRQAGIKVKGSSFIATACPVRSETDAALFVHEVSKQYFDASHNSYAYRLGFGPKSLHRTSDDGEPSGTAGKPIHQAMTGRHLTDIAVVVTRYFGGIKLGTGGLIRAYSDAAATVLDTCEITTHIIYQPVRVKFPYDETSTLMRLIGSLEARVIETRYDRDTEMTVDVRLRELDHFRERLIDATHGKAVILQD